MNEQKEMNYWPGFVDALSNVVLTLVFVLVVFVFALVISSDKLRKRAVELSDAVKNEEVAREDALAEKQDLQREQREVLAQLQAAQDRTRELETQQAALKRQLAEAQARLSEQPQSAALPPERKTSLIKERTEIQVVAPVVDAARGAADMSAEGGAIVLLFPRNVFQLDDSAKAALDKVLAMQGDALKGSLSSVLSIMGAETYSEARRLAYFRGLTVRNYLIDKGLGSGRTIHVMIEPAKEGVDGRVEIRFRRP